VVPVQTSLSHTSHWLTRVIAVTYLLLGLIMFVVPGWSAQHFPRKVSPFAAMTIGSYLLGSAWMAGVIQHTWTFARVTYLRGAIGLVAIIVIATLLNIGIFHFSAHPRHVVYLATYVVVMIGTVVILWWDRRETSRAATPAGLPGVQGPAGTPA
jgi:hypothetical protein